MRRTKLSELSSSKRVWIVNRPFNPIHLICMPLCNNFILFLTNSVNMKRVETCMHNKCMGLYGNLTFRFVLFCFADLRFRDKHSNESWNCFDKSSIPGALSSVPENFRRRLSPPDWPPLGLRREKCLISRFLEDVNKRRPNFLFLSGLEYGS